MEARMRVGGHAVHPMLVVSRLGCSNSAKRFAIVGAVVVAGVPALVFARKRVKASSARKALMRVKAEGQR
jgi:predicted naringenin-chalcone synthase